ncbi:MAG: hypothetical protein ACKV2T_06210 [Kofleriaceae bacterium]
MSAAADRQTKLSRTLSKLDKKALKLLGNDVAAASAACALSYTSDDGKTQTMPILLAPALLGRADAKYLHELVLTLYTAVEKTAAARVVDPEVRAILPLEAREEAWLGLAPITAAPLIGRFDMNIDPRKGGRSAQVLEFNGCAIGGLHYGPAASSTILTRVASMGTTTLVMPGSMTDAWLDRCRAHKAALGREGDALHVVWLEDRAWETGITEGPTLVAYLNANGHRASVCDPRDLEIAGGEICHDGVPIDIAYRAIELRDLLAIEDESGVESLAVMREAVKRNLVLSPLAGDLDHKSLLEIWSSKKFARLFSPSERKLLKRHVLWTRLVTDRRTDDMNGRDVDLGTFVRTNKNKLVLKPIRACGGEGILIGKDTPHRVWERAVKRSLANKDLAVAQQYIKGATIDSPVIRGTRIHHEKHFTNFGLFASDQTLGMLGRAAPFPVVNVSRGGGVLAVLLA